MAFGRKSAAPIATQHDQLVDLYNGLVDISVTEYCRNRDDYAAAYRSIATMLWPILTGLPDEEAEAQTDALWERLRQQARAEGR
jgi:hypothetical protein